jgi:ketosteroid isomerase-like protein
MRLGLSSRGFPTHRALFAIALVSLGSGIAGAADVDKEARLGERLAAISAAFNAADVPALRGMLGEHYSHTNNNAAPLNRADWLASITRRRADMDSGVLKITEATTSDIVVGTHGDTAVITGVYVMRGTRNGNAFATRINFTQVLEWDGQDWFRVAFHDTWTQLT